MSTIRGNAESRLGKVELLLHRLEAWVLSPTGERAFTSQTVTKEYGYDLREESGVHHRPLFAALRS